MPVPPARYARGGFKLSSLLLVPKKRLTLPRIHEGPRPRAIVPGSLHRGRFQIVKQQVPSLETGSTRSPDGGMGANRSSSPFGSGTDGDRSCLRIASGLLLTYSTWERGARLAISGAISSEFCRRNSRAPLAVGTDRREKNRH